MTSKLFYLIFDAIDFILGFCHTLMPQLLMFYMLIFGEKVNIQLGLSKQSNDSYKNNDHTIP